MSRTLRVRLVGRYEGQVELEVWNPDNPDESRRYYLPAAWLPVATEPGTIVTAREIAPATIRFGIARDQTGTTDEDDDSRELLEGLGLAGLPQADDSP